MFGFDRGKPIDRYYIEDFLKKYRADIRGRVLEIGDRQYTAFGEGRVTHSEVLHAVSGNPKATLVGDLATGVGIPKRTFDCMILTQTLPFIYPVKEAIHQIKNALLPGGVALVTVPGISQISRHDMELWGDYWRFTDASVKRLFSDVFGPENLTVITYGNVAAACAFLYGLASHELKEHELAYNDPNYQLIIGVRATRPLDGANGE